MGSKLGTGKTGVEKHPSAFSRSVGQIQRTKSLEQAGVSPRFLA